ncbi:MAG: folylpolyglutamate synthase/dihydrofolate synthase family protein [Bacteroidota bacterium]
MTYQETLAFLYRQLPMYQRQGKSAYKKDLTNTVLLLERLGNPHHTFRSIHIAGTNGKGSSAHALDAILRAAGYDVGLYTSPHLKSFTERIKINDQTISEQLVIEFVDMLGRSIEEIQPSFFELTVAMAFWHFARQSVDIAVIETGLGGRLDSTNVIQPLVSLITMIGWDHADMLGDTLGKIASEKAGIIKPGVPVVVGAHQPDLLPIFREKAEMTGSPLISRRDAYTWTSKEHQITNQVIDLKRDDQLLFGNLVVNNGADYVLENLPGVLEVIERLGKSGFPVREGDIREGLQTLTIPGRWQVIDTQPLTLADVSHNAPGLKSLMGQLTKEHRKKHIIFGIVKEKEIEDLLILLPTDAQYYWTQSSVPRSLPAVDLARTAGRLGREGTIYPMVSEALAAAKESATADDIILVCGSTFVVAEIPNL